MRRTLLFFFLLFCSQIIFSQQSKPPSVAFLLGKEALKNENAPLLDETAKAFNAMKNAAKKEGINLLIVSAYRSYAAQKRIWNRKYKRFRKEGLSPSQTIKKIIEYSTLPGTSRHHWGTEVDIIDSLPQVAGDVLLEKHFHGGPYTPLRLWLEKNASRYGFELVYTRDSLRNGFLYEPWHYSYASLSKDFLMLYLELDALEQIAKDTTLLGYKHITPSFLSQYKADHILGIAKQLKTNALSKICPD